MLEPSRAVVYSDKKSQTSGGYPCRDLVYGIPDSTKSAHRLLLIGDDLVQLSETMVGKARDTSIVEEYLNSLKIREKD
jgi:hypothetical protein